MNEKKTLLYEGRTLPSSFTHSETLQKQKTLTKSKINNILNDANFISSLYLL